jgi:hypothetical protein
MSNSSNTAPRPGEIVDQPPGSAFKGKRRVPGWLSHKTLFNGEYVFPDEALKTSPAGIVAFPPPGGDQNAFVEPLPSDDAETRNRFNSWILGSPFINSGKGLFDPLLERIANCVRNYNAALYWMRRLHLLENAEHIDTPPPRNPHGDKDDPPMPPGTKPTAEQILNAQEDWKTAVNNLDKALEPPSPLFQQIFADMIQVNGYIVSMRVVAQLAPPGSEFGGSSSSHISISSAFSSSSH